MGNALVGAAVQRALPINMRITAALMPIFRPKTLAICAQQGMNAAAVRLNEDTIQLSCEYCPKSLAIHGRALAMLH